MAGISRRETDSRGPITELRRTQEARFNRPPNEVVVETLSAIFARRTPLAFASDPVPDAVIDAILAAGHQAPCHKQTWPWRFVVVGRETREKMVPIAARLAAQAAKIEVSDKVIKSASATIMGPSALIAVVQVVNSDAFRAKEDYAATACAIQNMLLAAADAGFVSKWGTGGVTRDRDTHTLLGVDSGCEECVGFVWLGMPSRMAEVTRPPLHQHVVRLP